MSPRDKFDRFMADVRNGTNFKLARLSHAHYRALFSAVLPIAARSEIRGAFMVNGQPATEKDMRIMAPTLTTKECRAALEEFRAIGLLERDDELGAEWVHDFEEWNPEPRHDRTNSERQKRYRDRQKARNVTHNATHNGVETASVTPRNAHEVEVEVEVKPPTPFAVDLEEWLLHYEQTTGHKLPGRGTKAFHSIAESYNARRLEGHAAEDVRDAIDGAHFDEFRRLNGYDTADSILRPTKIGSLIARGRRHRLTHPVAPGEDRAARFASYQGTLK